MKTIEHPLRTRACLLAAAASLSTTSLWAQAPSPTLKETRVTATRFAEPEQSLPLGVSVITADEIRASGATTVNDALVRILGVPARQDLLNGGDASLDLRGFGATADANQMVILDGVRLTEGDLSAPRMAAIPIDSIERIEVLRGSGAVLYGEGATGGVIVISTKAGIGRQLPTGATLYGAAGSYGSRDLRASASVGTAGGFGLDAHAQKRRTDGYRRNAQSDTEAGSVTGQWSNDWLRAGVRLSRDDLDARLPGALSAAQYAADPRQAGRPADSASVRNDRAALFGEAQLGAWQLAFEAAKRDKELRSMNSGFAFDYDVEARNYGLRARNERAYGALKNTLVVGIDAGDWQRDVAGAFGSRATQQSRAFYAKDDVVLPGGTRISAGGRTESVERDSTSVTARVDRRENAWELGASHPVAPGWTAYARAGRSFRLPNADEFSFANPTQVLRPQVSRDYEIGTRWSHAKGSAQARLYLSRLSDEIGFDPAAGPFGFGDNVNFDPTRRQGLELDWSHALNAALGLRAHAAWREASFRAGPYAGKDVPLVPRRTAALRADWTPAAGHRVSGGANWVSSQHPDFANACRMPSYVTADARYAWQFRREAELAVGVTNLFDRKYFTQAFRCTGGVTQAIYPEPGRQVTASLRVQF